MPYVCKYYQRLVAFGSGQQFKICDSPAGEVFEDLYLFELHCVYLQSQILEGDEQVGWSIAEGGDSPDVEQAIANEETIAPFAHHAVNVFEAGHALDAPAVQFILNFAVDVFGEVVLDELDAFEQGAGEGEDVGLGGFDVEVGLGHRSLRDGLQQHSLQGHLRPFLGFGGHLWYDLLFDIYNSGSIIPMRPIEVRLVGRFRFAAKIPGQHEHLLYRGVHTQTQEMVFMKGEEYKLRPNDQVLTILQEGKILQIMQGGMGIPHMHWCGQQEDYNFIVLEELDRSLEQLYELCGGRFTQKTVLMLGQELVSILQYFHFKNFIHNQIKPANLMLGSGEKQNKIYITDYSAGARYKDAQTFQHISEINRQEPRTFNLQFSSLRYNRGQAISRRDDMESLVYLMLFWVKGSLPWTELARAAKKNDLDKIRMVIKMKQETPDEELFQGYPQLLQLFRYTRTLAYDEKPRYVYYKTVLKQKIQQLGYLDDKVYDWMLLDQPEPMEDLELNFDVIPNEAEFLKQIREELKVREKAEEKEKKVSVPSIKSPKNKQKNKDCIIY